MPRNTRTIIAEANSVNTIKTELSMRDAPVFSIAINTTIAEIAINKATYLNIRIDAKKYP